jgi:NAD(P)-dependent dehydrogenase (short-subunit alcohol dehydrogenase family)
VADGTRTALVSGANRGIGLEVARQLGRLGHRVLLGAREPARGEEAAARLRAEGIDITPVTLDVADPRSVGRLTAEGHDVDVLVNNAGVVLDEGKRPLDLDEETVRATLEVNLMGALRLAQAVAPGMAARGWGRVVNVSSGMGQLAEMGGGSLAYRLSKASLNVLTRVLAHELRGQGVKVNSACPGWVRTDMGGASAPRTVGQGAETIVWLATLPDDGPQAGSSETSGRSRGDAGRLGRGMPPG